MSGFHRKSIDLSSDWQSTLGRSDHIYEGLSARPTFVDVNFKISEFITIQSTVRHVLIGFDTKLFSACGLLPYNKWLA